MKEKLTAYALNEMPPEERAEFEAQLLNNPELRKEAEEMKAFCTLLNEHVVRKEADSLTSQQRANLTQAFAGARPAAGKIIRPFWKHPFFISTTAVAACVTFAVVKYADQTQLVEYEQTAAYAPQKSEKVRVTATVPEALQKPLEVAANQPALLPAHPDAKLKENSVLASAAKASESMARSSSVASATEASSGTQVGASAGLPPLPNLPSPVPSPNEGVLMEKKKSNGSAFGDVVLGERIEDMPEMSSVVTGGAKGSDGFGTGVGVGGSVRSNGGSHPSENLGRGKADLLAASDGPKKQPAAPSPTMVTAPNQSNMSLGLEPAASAAPSPVPSSAPAEVAASSSSALATDKAKVQERTRFAETAKDSNGRAYRYLRTDVNEESENLRVSEFDKRQAGAKEAPSGEAYMAIQENPFLPVAQQPLSTFSIDVDTASYANVRRFLNNGQRPPSDAVRLEELINYFPYSYEAPAQEKPFSVMVDIAEAPWNTSHRLARVALKGRANPQQDAAANFVFLVDVSGSMDEPDKLPLVQKSLNMLVGELRKTDRVALVVYAGKSGLVLPSTAADEKETLLQAIENLKAGGSTNGAGGIRMAYDQATKNFIKGGVNRVILCTDGDFNVGISSPQELEKLITAKAKSGVFLSVLGYGTGNLQDRTMETLADKGNGNYAYIDSLSEARKVLVEQMQSTLVTIAKDVKIQVEFNPAQVSGYRLIGYENRALAKEDFNNDRKDAGEIGAGHTVTALYEIVPAGVLLAEGKPVVDELKYARKPEAAPADPAPAAAPAPATSTSHEMMTVKLRYKQPDGDKSDLIEVPVVDKEMKMEQSPRDFQFAASVAGFGMLLRDSSHAGELTWDMVRDLALRGKGEDTLGYRGEFLQLIDKARGIAGDLR